VAHTASAGALPYGAPAEATARFCPWCYRDGSDATCSVQAHWPEVRPTTRSTSPASSALPPGGMEAAGLGVGLMLQPGSGLAGQAEHRRWWAADNGCFSQGAAFDDQAWFAWLASLPEVGRRRRTPIAVPPQPYPKRRDD
jgi:hypothetical protein